MSTFTDTNNGIMMMHNENARCWEDVSDDTCEEHTAMEGMNATHDTKVARWTNRFAASKRYQLDDG